MPSNLFSIYISAVFLLTLSAAQAETYTYPQLVQRMTDMQELANLPPVGEKTALASSYDRASKYDPSTDTYINWGANNDGSGIIRKEGDESVLAEIQGPGCIWRTWSATASRGHVKIYLDGSATPTIDLPFIDYFTRKVAPFNRPNLVYILNGNPEPPGFDNYTPISFAKSCRIIADKGFGNYYQFTYTQFAPGTVVPTFQMNLTPNDSAALDKANQILGQCGQYPGNAATGSKTDKQTVNVESGKEAVVADLTGPQAITSLKLKLDLPADPEAQRLLLRQLTVSITWDDDAAPAIWSPLGDFFGYVGGAEPYQSLPAGYTKEGGFYSYWYMPFAKKAHIVIGNDGPQAISTSWEITHAPLVEPVESLARFHAKWHRDAFVPDRADRKPDWTLLDTTGRGRYVGTHLHGWNPSGGWWGEGDDKFFVDGEKFPSSFGTGSEDYFGYAWSSPKLFSRPYHDQILNENNSGHFDDNRWHIPDSIPFQQSLEADIEKYFSNERGTLYAAEVFWYLNAGGTDPYAAVPVGDRAGYWVTAPTPGSPEIIAGAMLLPIGYPPHFPSAQDMTSFGTGWTGGKQLFWQGAMGGTIELPLSIGKPGKYHLFLRGTKAPDYGIVQVSLDGNKLGDPMDFYAPTVTLADEVDLGAHDFSRGPHTLKLQVTGENEASTNTYFGLDYLELTQ